MPKLVLGLIGLALVAAFLVGLAAPSAAFAANKRPSVTHLSPASGTTAGGTTVVISGHCFTSSGRSLVTKVKFGTKAARYHVNAHSQVICKAPAGKGTVNVIVTTKGGASARVAADRYTYKAPLAAPTITVFALSAHGAVVGGVIDQNAHTIAAIVPFGTDLGALVATFTTTGSAVKVGGVTQASGVTANNFGAPVVYTVTAAGGVARNYTVTVTVAADPAKAITAFSFNDLEPAVSGAIDESAHSITLTVPYGTDLSDLAASFTSTGASVTVGGAAQTSGDTDHDFSGPVTYTVTAADGSRQIYTVTVTVAPLAIGQAYQGGIVAYILQPTDPGYVAGQTHGLIAATGDQSPFAPPVVGIQWAVTAGQSSVVPAPGATGTAIGTGAANTNAIVAQNGAGSSYAAGLADAYTNTDTGTGVYSDWYLPSKDELTKLDISRTLIGDNFLNGAYWSSSESSATLAWCQNFSGSGPAQNGYKYGTLAVRAVRSF